jgi:hypothetical protein
MNLYPIILFVPFPTVSAEGGAVIFDTLDPMSNVGFFVF